MKKLILILMLIAGFAGAATIQSTGGGSTAIVSGTTPITGGGDTQVCFNDAGKLSCGDAGCVYNKTTNTLTCDAFAGALTGNASTATALAGGAADQVMVQTGAGAGTFRTLPTSVQNGPAVTATVVYDSNTDLFSSREGTLLPFMSGKVTSFQFLNTVAAGSFVGVGENNAGAVGTSAVYTADATTFSRSYAVMTTKVGTPASGDAAGYQGLPNAIDTDYAPKLVLAIATPATITSMRIWAGLASGTIVAVPDDTTNQASRIIAFAYDTGGAANTANWHIVTCTGTGAGSSCGNDDTTMPVQASHEYRMILDMPTVSTVYWRIVDVTAGTTASGSRSATLPATDLPIGWQCYVTTLTSAQRALWMNGEALEHN